MSSAALLGADFGSESDDDNFNPAPADDSDNEATRDKAAAPGGNGSNVDGAEDGVVGDEEEDNDEEDDDEEEEDEEEEEISGRPRKRSRRDPRNQYLDVEAEVDEEDEGDEEDEEGQADPFIADTHPDDLADLPVGAETDDRRHRELDRQREMNLEMDAEKQAKILNERYSSKRAQTNDSVTIPKRLLLPTVDDPSIWMVKTKPLKEKEVVMYLMKRAEDRARCVDAPPIFCAFERCGHMPGWVFIEARRQADVFKALEGVYHCFPRSKIVLSPIKEMPDLLRVNKNKELQPGGYVRVKRGKYAFDLAQIDDVETNGLNVTLKLVPRLDYGLNEDVKAPKATVAAKADAAKRKRPGASVKIPLYRPPQRLFSEIEAKKKEAKYLHAVSTFDKKHWTYHGDTYINGFLIKDFKIQHLLTEGVNPTLEEVTKFTAGAEDGTENLDLSALLASTKRNSSGKSYSPGDIVEVYEGEQQGVRGKTVSVRADIVTLEVTEGELQGQSIEVPVKGLRKIFREGDHVQVSGGSAYYGAVGMVVCIKDDTVTILTDHEMQEITVFSKDLREASSDSYGPDFTKMNPALQRNGATGQDIMAPPKIKYTYDAPDYAAGHTVVIKKGQYKGLLGRVRYTTDEIGRVELYTKSAIISVPKDALGFKDPITGQPIEVKGYGGYRGRGDRGRGRFPGANTSRVPEWSGNRTPVPTVQGNRTPAWGAHAAGNRTAYGGTAGSGGRTPAWDPGARTAYGGSTTYGGTSGSGGRTPAWDPGARTSYGGTTASGSRTPAWDPAASSASATTINTAANSRIWDPPTPGKDTHAAPTPSNVYTPATPAPVASTPKFSGYAGEAPTPYSGEPETPAWGGDDAPRYEDGSPSP